MDEDRRIKIIAISDRVCNGQWSGYDPTFMKKGWITWASGKYLNRWGWENKDHWGLYIEDNKYCADFYRNAFIEYVDSPYKRKLRANKLKREEVIKQSEITHKVTLISI